MPDTLHACFEAQATLFPRQIAVTFEGQSITYKKLNARANQLAHALRTLGVKPDMPVAFCMERSIEMLVAMLGILKSGGAYVPLDPDNPENRLSWILEDTRTPLLITQSSFKKRFAHYKGELILLDQKNKLQKQATDNPSPSATAQHLAYIIYSSGTTGRPKGIMIEHKSVIHYSQWFADYVPCCPQQRIDFSSNYCFDMSISTTIVPLMLGLTVVICQKDVKNNLLAYLQHLAKHKVAIVKMTPSYLRALLHTLKRHTTQLPHLKALILGGENLSAADCNTWLNHYPQHLLFNEYGPTEATVAVTQLKMSVNARPALDQHVPIGEPGPHIKCFIFDAQQKPVLNNEPGELYISGSCLARGYLNQPELTAKQFIIDPQNPHMRLYKTGDLCQQLPNGMLNCIGRIDDQIKIRGFRIEPLEIEQCLKNNPLIDEAVVIVKNYTPNEKRLIAYYQAKNPEQPPENSAIRQHLQQYLPDYMIPSAFVHITTMPLTENGKLDHAALPLLPSTITQTHQAPTNALEKTLTDIWSEVLDIHPIGIKDNFFELGGDSLSAARIVAIIQQTITKKIYLPNFYQAENIQALAQTIQKKGKKRIKSTPSHLATPSEKRLPLSDFQLMLWMSQTFAPTVKKLNIVTRKRLQGTVNINALHAALNAVIKKHEVLSYHILKFRPAQMIKKTLNVTLKMTDLSALSKPEYESALEVAIMQLREYYPWRKKEPLLKVHLFRLSSRLYEIQLCMPHTIADNTSTDVLLADLSQFYLLYPDNILTEPDQKHRDYLLEEQQYLHTHTQRDGIFWKNYVKDARLFEFPIQHIVEKTTAFTYSTYIKIPEKYIHHLQQCCAAHHVSLNDGLSAALVLALSKHNITQSDNKQPVIINPVKSNRDNPYFDKTIGCFLKIEPIKIMVEPNSDVLSLAGAIRQATMETHPYQRASNLLKLACISKIYQKRAFIKEYIIRLFSYVYTTLYRTPALNHQILKQCGALSALGKNNNFIVNVNVHHHFIKTLSKQHHQPILGLITKKIKQEPYDLLNVNYLLEASFLREDDAAYLAISANLTPNFRRRLARDVIDYMKNA